MTLQNNRAPLLCYFKLSTHFAQFWWKIGVEIHFPQILLKYRGRNYINFPETWKKGVEMEEHMKWRSICSNLHGVNTPIGEFLELRPLKFDGWPSKTIGHLFYATSSFVQHFIAIGEFKLELQSGNAQSGSNSAILAPCDLEIWRMTLKNNRAPLLSNIKLIVSFHHHMWIQTGVTVPSHSAICHFNNSNSTKLLPSQNFPCMVFFCFVFITGMVFFCFVFITGIFLFYFFT